MATTTKNLKDLNIADLTQVILADWTNPYFGAVPYIDAMRQINDVHQMYGMDPASDILRYFLANAGTWRGETAREVKAEIKRRLK